MAQEIQLTPAEIEIIRLKREQDELKQLEEELRKKAQLEREIANKVDHIMRDQIEHEAVFTTVRRFFKELVAIDSSAQLIESNKQKVAEIYRYENGNKSTVWERDYIVHLGYIKIGEYNVKVEKHRGNDKMYVNGPGIDYKTQCRGYTRAKKVIEVINTTISNIRYKEEVTQRALNAVESTVEKMKSKYPDASVSSCKESIQYGGYRRVNYELIDVVKIEFVNGIQIVYRVYSDGTLGRRALNFTGKVSHWQLMDSLSKMDFKENIES